MERYTFNPVAKTMVITAAFAKAIQDINSDEYALYSQLMTDIPNLEVIRKTHASPKKCVSKSGETFNCNQFKNLTYDNMEKFIKALPDNDEYLKQFSFAKHSAAVIQTNRYKVVREWFVAQFPEYRKNPLFYLYNHPQLIYFTDIQKQEEETMENAG